MSGARLGSTVLVKMPRVVKWIALVSAGPVTGEFTGLVPTLALAVFTTKLEYSVNLKELPVQAL